MSLAKRIHDCRYAKGWGPDELAQKANISRTALYQIECGKTEAPRAGTIRRIARALEVPVERLLGLEAAEPEPESVSAAAAVEVFAGAPEPSVYTRFDAPRDRPYAERLPSVPGYSARSNPTARETDLLLKLKEILASPLGESVSRIVEESYRILPALRSV